MNSAMFHGFADEFEKIAVSAGWIAQRVGNFAERGAGPASDRAVRVADFMKRRMARKPAAAYDTVDRAVWGAAKNTRVPGGFGEANQALHAGHEGEMVRPDVMQKAYDIARKRRLDNGLALSLRKLREAGGHVPAPTAKPAVAAAPAVAKPAAPALHPTTPVATAAPSTPAAAASPVQQKRPFPKWVAPAAAGVGAVGVGTAAYAAGRRGDQ